MLRDLQGRVALERGPIVYCLEGIDHAGISLDRITIDPGNISNDFQVEQDGQLLSGVSVRYWHGCGGGWVGERSVPQSTTIVQKHRYQVDTLFCLG